MRHHDKGPSGPHATLGKRTPPVRAHLPSTHPAPKRGAPAALRPLAFLELICFTMILVHGYVQKSQDGSMSRPAWGKPCGNHHKKSREGTHPVNPLVHCVHRSAVNRTHARLGVVKRLTIIGQKVEAQKQECPFDTPLLRPCRCRCSSRVAGDPNRPG